VLRGGCWVRAERVDKQAKEGVRQAKGESKPLMQATKQAGKASAYLQDGAGNREQFKHVLRAVACA